MNFEKCVFGSAAARIQRSILRLALVMSCQRAESAQTASAPGDEPQLIALLQSGATLQQKDAACARLTWFTTHSTRLPSAMARWMRPGISASSTCDTL